MIELWISASCLWVSKGKAQPELRKSKFKGWPGCKTSYLSLGDILILSGTFKSYYRKNKTSPGTPCSRIKFECEQCLITALDHKRMPWPPHKWFGGNPGITALKAAFMDSLCLQGVFTTKPKQSGSLNHKARVWSFHFVWIHALKPAVWGCPKVNLQTKHPSLGAAAMIQVQASKAFLCFSFYHVHFELLLPALNFSSHHWGFCLKQRKGRADFRDQKTPE